MTPVSHGMIGWLIAQPLIHRRDRILVTVAALVPDLDGLGLAVSLDYYSKYHHVFGHNVFLGLLLALVTLLYGIEKFKCAMLVFVAFNSHIFTDLLGSGVGWGVPYFWPLNDHVFEFHPPFQWELDSWQNFVATVIFLIMIVFVSVHKKRTIVETFSLSWDLKVVAILNRWLRRS